MSENCNSPATRLILFFFFFRLEKESKLGSQILQQEGKKKFLTQESILRQKDETDKLKYPNLF